MIAIVIVLAVVGAILLKSSSASTPARTPVISGNRPPTATSVSNPSASATRPPGGTYVQSPTFFNTPATSGGARQISGLLPADNTQVAATLDQIPTVAKPQCVITSYSPQTGQMTIFTQYAGKAWGEASDKSIVFSIDISADGTQSASFPAGTEIDYVMVSGPGGTIIVQNPLLGTGSGMVTPSTNSPSDVLVPPSDGLSNGPSVLPSPESADNPYPASTDTFVMPTSVESGSVNPDNAIVSLV